MVAVCGMASVGGISGEISWVRGYWRFEGITADRQCSLI